MQADSWQEMPQNDPLTFIRMRQSTVRKAKVMKRRYGFQSYEGLIIHLMEMAEKTGMAPEADYKNVFEKTAATPVMITGLPRQGKTTTVKEILRQLTSPRTNFGQVHQGENAFVIDVHDEYGDIGFKDVKERVFAMDWRAYKSAKLRYVPNSNVETSRTQIHILLGNLNQIKPSGALRSWTIVIEEAERFATDPDMRSFVNEAGKFLRKLIIVTSDWRAFEGMAVILRPKSFSSETLQRPPVSQL
ncbi:MAG: hypothetical protein JRN68_05720 [Nitrososphaerota archaeon]|nr:hypothetical protein [Nitrososphaerota archaeon]